MKYCPACNFSFPDFHHVCDFDGTELVTEPERQALVVRPSPLRSALKSPAFLSVLLAIALLSSAIMIGYLETRSTHVATNEPAIVPADANPVENGGQQSRRPSRRLAHLFHNHKRNLNRLPATGARLREETASTRAVAKRHQRVTAGSSTKTETVRSGEAQRSPASTVMNQTARASQIPARSTAPQNTQFAASRNFESASHPKEPKLTAMLKTTWHVLKKPFKF